MRRKYKTATFDGVSYYMLTKEEVLALEEYKLDAEVLATLTKAGKLAEKWTTTNAPRVRGKAKAKTALSPEQKERKAEIMLRFYEKKYGYKVCEQCKGSFLAKSSTVATCSRVCSGEARRGVPYQKDLLSPVTTLDGARRPESGSFTLQG